MSGKVFWRQTWEWNLSRLFRSGGGKGRHLTLICISWGKHYSDKLEGLLIPSWCFCFCFVRGSSASLFIGSKDGHFTRFCEKLSSVLMSLLTSWSYIRIQRNQKICPRSKTESELSLELCVQSWEPRSGHHLLFLLCLSASLLSSRCLLLFPFLSTGPVFTPPCFPPLLDLIADQQWCFVLLPPAPRIQYRKETGRRIFVRVRLRPGNLAETVCITVFVTFRKQTGPGRD